MKNKLFTATIVMLLIGALTMIISLDKVKKSVSIMEEINAQTTEPITTSEVKIKGQKTTQVANANEKVYDIDDNNKISWSNLCFSIENNQLYVYLNTYTNKYKTSVRNVEYMYFIENTETGEGTIVVAGDDVIEKFTFKNTDEFNKDNLKDLLGTVKKITQ